jgi:hypothetical protein
VQARVFRFVHDAHAPAPQLFDDAVMRDDAADQVVGGGCFAIMPVRDGCSGHFYRGAFEEAARLFFGSEQRPHFAFQLAVAVAGLPQKPVALTGRELQRGLQEAIDLFPSIGVHRISWR